tara:strand:+ start:226 stop:753 length:528 start_codon:yes stop_codon:yes gene_type:complete
MALTRIGLNQSINLASNVTGTLPTANGGTGATSFVKGKVLQQVETTVSGQVAFNSTTYTDYSGATLNITPAATSSKIKLEVKFSYYLDDEDGFSIKVIRTVSSSDTTVISYSSTYSTYQSVNGSLYDFWFDTATDSPSTSAQCTYKLQIASEANRTIHLQPQGGNLVLRATEIGA